MTAPTLKPDRSIDGDDMWKIVDVHIKEHKFSKGATDSMDDFYSIGIPQIMTRGFDIGGTVQDIRAKSSDGRQIDKIQFSVTMNNIQLKRPVTNGYSSGRERMLTPHIAHLEDRSYSSSLCTDAKFQATAYYKDGNEVTRTADIKTHRIGGVPTMTGSKLCHLTDMSWDALVQMHEDPHDPLGFFVKSGKEWTINNVESVAYNQARIFKNSWKTEVQRLEFISKPGDTYQNSKQVIIRIMTTGCLTIEAGSLNLKEIQFPFYMIFRALGWATDAQMLGYILEYDIGHPGADNVPLPPIVSNMYSVLRDAMFASYDGRAHKFGSPLDIHSQTEVLQYLVRHVPKDTYRDLDLSKDEHMHQAVRDLLSRLDDEFLPHIGQSERDRPAKLRFLACLIRFKLLVHLGLNEQTDRDSYLFKRIHTPGVSLAKTFKTHYNTASAAAKKALASEFKSVDFKHVDMARVFTANFSGEAIERLMMQSIASGHKSQLKVSRVRQITNRLSSQLRDNKNQTKTLSTLRMVISLSSDATKGSDRAKIMRGLHPADAGFLCRIQSPEGQDVGLHKQLAVSAEVSSFGSSELLKDRVMKMTDLIVPVEAVQLYGQFALMRKVFLNGEWIGCTPATYRFVAAVIEDRRAGNIDKYTTVQWDPDNDDVYLWVDYGRPVRPLTIVYNNIRDWKFLGLKGPAPLDRYEQFTLLKREHIDGMESGKIGVEYLVKNRIIEYVTPGEQAMLDVACDVNHLNEHARDPLRQFTHCDIADAMFGIAALTGPLQNYNHTPRNVFQALQVRQTGGVYAFNWAYRIDKDTFLQYQVGAPLVYTRINHYIDPTGDNVISANMCYSGYNEDDSLLFSKALNERLKFAGAWFTYDKSELQKNEKFGPPDAKSTSGIKRYAKYGKLNARGHIPVGAIARKDDIVIGKTRRLPKNVAEESGMESSDQSLPYRSSTPAIVHNVFEGKDDGATPFVKVGFKVPKPIVIGDKFSSRAGQKGVCGFCLPQSSMPFASDGMIISKCMNPHSFPKRCTMGHIIEGSLGVICAQRGVTCDGTTFRKVELDDIMEEMKRLGFDRFGQRRLYSGITGCWIDSLIYVGPVYYQRLQKFVAKSIYAIDVGPTDIITRQPLDGKANQGGLRISELQRDVFLSHGAARFFTEKFFEDSDYFEVQYCRCGSRGIVNPGMEIYKCNTCGDNADIYSVASSWSSKQLLLELNAMNVGTRVHLQPFTFYSTPSVSS